MTAAYRTVFGSLANYRKGTIELVKGDARHYAFSNVFEVAEKSAPYEKVIVGLNLGYVIEVLRAEGRSAWYTCAHDEFAICMDGDVRIDFLKLDQPLANATLDIWQTATNGMYSGQDTEQPVGNLRGRYRTDHQGRYAIRTVLPVSYPIPTDGPVGQLLSATGRHPWRPAHLHFMIEAPEHRTLVTHLFNHDDPYLDSDAVFGVKDSLRVVYTPRRASDPMGEAFGFTGEFRHASYDFVLPRVSS